MDSLSKFTGWFYDLAGFFVIFFLAFSLYRMPFDVNSFRTRMFDVVCSSTGCYSTGYIFGCVLDCSDQLFTLHYQIFKEEKEWLETMTK